jgi:hypothetical protein
LARRALPLLVVPLAIFMIARVREPLVPILLLHLAAFTAIALACHGDLAGDRPAADDLTQFYFWVSFGGMLGGVFNTFVAPNLFAGVTEYPLVVVVACLLLFATATATATATDYTEHTEYLDARFRVFRVFRGKEQHSIVAAIVALLTCAGMALCRADRLSLGWQLAALSVPAVVAFRGGVADAHSERLWPRCCRSGCCSPTATTVCCTPRAPFSASTA